MTSIFKYLKDAKLEVFLITLLLIVQAYCDLALPSYMSDIVDVGINGSGIAQNVPDRITGYGMSQLEAFMSEEDAAVLQSSYSETGSKLENIKLSEGYVIENYECELKDDADEDELEKIMEGPMTILGLMQTMQENTSDAFDEDAPASDGSVMDMMSDEQVLALDIIMSVESTQDERAVAVDTFLDGFDMRDTIVSTYVPKFIEGQYIDCGVDMGAFQKAYLVKTGAKMLGFALLGMAAAVMVGFIASRVGARTAMNLRNNVFKKVVSFSNAEMDKYSTASLITRNTNDIQQIQMVLTILLRIVLYAPILCIGGILKVVNTDLSMAWIIVAGALAIICIVFVLFAVAMPKFKIMQTLVDRVNLVAREILTGLPVIRVFTRDKHEHERFEEANTNLYRTQLFTNRVMTFMMPVMMLVMNCISLAIVWFGAKGIDDGTIQMGDMMAFITYSMLVIMSFLLITMVSIMLPRAGVAAERINEVLRTEVTIKENDSPVAAQGNGVVEFRDVCFKYSDADDYVLENITFTAKPGITTAVIGSTGSGKSTLVNLIPRLYDVTDGEILVDGVNVKDMSKHDLRNMLGFVPQKGVLFSGTIESNIKFGRENASDDEMRLAAEIAQATEFIDTKPEKYGSPIAQGGSNVSGGQKQRISIARAIAKKPKIFVFDDSFSALDFKTDKQLRRALGENTSGCMVIIVAQRISTILNADNIIVLDEGKIAGMGTHRELLKNCDVYRQIAESQLSEKEIEATLSESDSRNVDIDTKGVLA